MISVMVAEDSKEQNLKCCEFLTKDKDISIISSTLDGISTIEKYEEFKPDVLLLDLDLPLLNGLDIIERLSTDIDERKKCNIIIITATSMLRLNVFNTSKIYKIFPKPFNLDDVLCAVKEIGEAHVTVSEREIKELLLKLKFNIYSKGTQYIIQGISLAFNNTELLSNITELYKEISKTNGEKINRTQRSIRSSIDTMNCHITKELKRSFFKIYNNDIITPKYFFSTVVDYLIDVKGK